MADQAAKVAKGAKFLDKNLPDWATKIKQKKLTMDDNDCCILGQLNEGEGDAYTLASQLKLTEKKLVDLGFEVTYDEEEEVYTAALADAWKAEIDKRIPKEAPKKKVKAKTKTKKEE